MFPIHCFFLVPVYVQESFFLELIIHNTGTGWWFCGRFWEQDSMGDIEQSHGDREAPGPEWGHTGFRGGVSRLNKPEVTSSRSGGITAREAEQPPDHT